MLEKQIEAKLTQAARAQGGDAYKWTSPGNAGVPDRLVILPGGCIGMIEVKQPGKTPTKLQAIQHSRLSALGCYVAVLDDPANIPTLLQDIKRHYGGLGS